MAGLNPYDGLDFWNFIYVFIQRIYLFIQGNLPLSQLATDEIQILVLVAIAASSALVGTFLVLRKMTMLANSLSHTILVGIVIAFLFSQSGMGDEHGHHLSTPLMLFAALITGIITALLTEGMTKIARLQEDASIGLVFTSLFAVGIVLVTLLSRNAHIGTEAVMGNVDALHLDDLRLVWIIFLLNLALTLFFLKEYKISTFDPALASALGISPIIFNYLLMLQASATVVGAFRAVGVLMVLAFITGPVLAARLLTHNLASMISIAIGLGCLASFIGVALSRHLFSVYNLALSTSGLVVCVLCAIFVVVALFYCLPLKKDLQDIQDSQD